MGGPGLQLAFFTVLDMVLDILIKIWPPETFVDGCCSVVDARVSSFIVKLGESLLSVVACF